MNKEKLKKIIGLISISLLALMGILGGSKMWFENTSRDLNQVSQTTGTIELTEIVSKNSKAGATPFMYVNQKYLGIKLISSDKLFMTFNPKQSYRKLQKLLPNGRKITIFHNNSLKNNIYQIESDKQVLLEHSKYQNNHRIAAIAIFAFGMITLGIGIYSFRHQLNK